MELLETSLGSMRVDEILRLARERGASDVHLAANLPPRLRIDGDLVEPREANLRATEIAAFVATRVDEGSRRKLEASGACDSAVQLDDAGALRVHAFRARNGLRCAIRLLPAAVPALETLDAPSVVADLALRRNGLILIAGPTGSGKTTLLASMIDHINQGHPRHVVTLEDPIEYVHIPAQSIVAQCEIGRDVATFADGIRGMLRADPDTIAIGELRDLDAMRVALSAAETGHLVLASLHTADASQAVDRVIDAFPVDGRDGARVQLAQTLVAIVALRLVRRLRGTGRRAAFELLLGTDAVRNLIREGKTHQLRSAMQTGRTFGMQTLEMHLRELVERGETSLDSARTWASRPHELAQEEDGVR